MQEAHRNEIDPRIRVAFSETCDPLGYVARDATERALSEIDEWCQRRGDRGAPGLAFLTGPPGVGRTFLLRTIESVRNGGWLADAPAAAGLGAPRALYLPYAGLSPIDLGLWICGLLGRSLEPADLVDSARILAALAGLSRSEDEPLLLVLDDSDSIHPETLETLAQGLSEGALGESLFVLLAVTDDPRGMQVAARLREVGAREMARLAPMTADETASYLRGRLRWAGLSEREVDSLDELGLAEICERSEGLPRRLHAVALEAFEVGRVALRAAADGETGPAGWLGTPIEDDPSR